MGIAQDKLGVKIGLDESVASARMSRYETARHEPSAQTAKAIAQALSVPLVYLYCEDDRLAEIILAASELPQSEQDQLLESIRQRLEDLKKNPSSNS